MNLFIFSVSVPSPATCEPKCQNVVTVAHLAMFILSANRMHWKFYFRIHSGEFNSSPAQIIDRDAVVWRVKRKKEKNKSCNNNNMCSLDGSEKSRVWDNDLTPNVIPLQVCGVFPACHFVYNINYRMEIQTPWETLWYTVGRKELRERRERKSQLI